MGLDIGDIGEIKLMADDKLGDLQLGRIGQKYLSDPDLRRILSCAVLDADRMMPYQDQELLLITSVVYSEKFEVAGKRKREVCTLSLPSLCMTFCVSYFISSHSFELKWLASSRVSGELVVNQFSFPLAFSGN